MTNITPKEALLYPGGLGDHSSHMFEAGSMNSAEAAYNEAYMACMVTHLIKTLNHIEEVIYESNEDDATYTWTYQLWT
jgi:hypothetical protein